MAPERDMRLSGPWVPRLRCSRTWRRVIWYTSSDVTDEAALQLLTWWLKQHFLSNRWYSCTKLHGVTSKTALIFNTALFFAVSHITASLALSALFILQVAWVLLISLTIRYYLYMQPHQSFILMVQSPPWEAYSRPANQVIPYILQNPKFNWHDPHSLQLEPSWRRQIHFTSS